MSNLIQQGDQFIASDEPADNSYGRNGYQGAASDLPGKRTATGFLPQASAPIINRQTRAVSNEQYPTAHGNKPATPNAVKVPASTDRGSVKR